MQCRHGQYIHRKAAIIMNDTQLQYGHLLPDNTQKYAVDGIEICIDCGSIETTILTRGLYCRTCRSFRLFHNRLNDMYRHTDTVLDFD